MYHTAILMSKYINRYAPSYLCNQVVLSRDTAIYRTRSTERNDIILPFPKKEICKRSFMYNGASVFNSLPTFLKECDNIYDFKKQYKAFYFN